MLTSGALASSLSHARISVRRLLLELRHYARKSRIGDSYRGHADAGRCAGEAAVFRSAAGSDARACRLAGYLARVSGRCASVSRRIAERPVNGHLRGPRGPGYAGARPGGRAHHDAGAGRFGGLVGIARQREHDHVGGGVGRYANCRRSSGRRTVAVPNGPHVRLSSHAAGSARSGQSTRGHETATARLVCRNRAGLFHTARIETRFPGRVS